jgi:hypothetical protein
MIVNLSELKSALLYIDKLNQAELASIEWVDYEGKKIDIDPGLIESWRYVGLSNKVFAEQVIMLEDGQQRVDYHTILA